ncbi:unnamed protein product [Microthlaspi erraticum]|uniref:Uncharacterized protein n=1 Tax=Microthlaspi erraticum TaxID=1685480 RepID=A0A6D2K1V3_9BRAS|nr:unnamed protein product [Microthlaspi erraticum]CAA7043360.1 unnamed protein product [Microthlaspi erraticum]
MTVVVVIDDGDCSGDGGAIVSYQQHISSQIWALPFFFPKVMVMMVKMMTITPVMNSVIGLLINSVIV